MESGAIMGRWPKSISEVTMPNPEASAATPNNGPSPALRVTFAYRGHDIAVANTRAVRMIVPRPVSSPPEKGQSGYWVEVRAADGKLLFHCVLHNPVRVDVEVYSHDERQSITRVPVAEPRGEFEVLLPDLPEAQSLVLFGPPADARLQAAPARELVRVGFDELRKAPPNTPAPGRGAPSTGRG
jgi:hypothetical protein